MPLEKEILARSTPARAATLLALLLSSPAAAIEMSEVATAPAALRMSPRSVIDLDHDGALEFIITRDFELNIVDIYESTGDNAFDLVHSHEISGPGLVYSLPLDVGDSDEDNRSELFVSERIHNDFVIKLPFVAGKTLTKSTSV